MTSYKTRRREQRLGARIHPRPHTLDLIYFSEGFTSSWFNTTTQYKFHFSHV